MIQDGPVRLDPGAYPENIRKRSLSVGLTELGKHEPEAAGSQCGKSLWQRKATPEEALIDRERLNLGHIF